MGKKVIIILCEGAHDVSFLYRILKTMGFKSFGKKVKDLPVPINLLLSNPKFMISEPIENLSLENASSRLFPREVLENENNIFFLFPMSGDSQSVNRKRLIETFHAAIAIEDSDAETFSDDSIFSIIYFLDSDDKGVKKRLDLVNNELKSLFPNEAIASFTDNGQVVNCKNLEFGVFVFTETGNDFGRLEDIIIPIMKSGNQDIFDRAEQYLNIHRDVNLFKNVLTIDEEGSIKKVDGIKYDYKKSLVGSVGQLQTSGKSNVQCIREGSYITEDKIIANSNCQKIIEFLNSVML